MDNGTGIQPVMPIGGYGYNDGFGGGGGSFMWIFGLITLLALFNGGFGGWGGNNSFANAIGYENLATSNEVQRGFDNQNLQAQTRDILSAVTNGTAQTIAASTANATNAINAIKDGNASLIREFGNVETALTALGGQQQECCCNVLRGIDGVNYNGAINTAAINANTTAQIQSLKDMLVAQRDQEQQARIQNLELQQAMNGVLRFPNQWSYGAGPFPPIFGGCCGNGGFANV